MDNQFGAFLFLILMLMISCPVPADGAMRGPHHPRNSPKRDTNKQGHNHYVPRARPVGGGEEPAPILTHDTNILHDQEHIKEDLGEWVTADGKEMTSEEMEFHYFRMHDYDQNSLLDGLEILQAISHIMPDDADLTGHGQQPSNGAANPKQIVSQEDRQKQMDDDFNYYIELIDRVLEEDDLNKDGYLSYFEYATGRMRDDTREKALRSSNPNSSHQI